MTAIACRHACRLVGAAGMAATLLFFTGRGLAWAHANLERAEPASGANVEHAPEELRLSFSEAVDGSFSTVQVLNARRERVDRGDSHVDAADRRVMTLSISDGLPDGIYTVAWRTLSAVDGHTVSGSYPLLVGDVTELGDAAVAPSATATFAPEGAVARWWLFVTAGLVFGALLSWHAVYRPLLGARSRSAQDPARRHLRTLLLVAGGSLLVGTLYAALAQAAVAGEVPLWQAFGAPLEGVLTRGRYASIWWARLALVLVTLALVAARGGAGWSGRLALLASAGVLLTSSFTSHSAGLASGPHVGVAVDWLHFTSVAAWLGGLASLLAVLPHAANAASEPAAFRAQAVGRFSSLALASVGVAVVTGLFETWLHVGSWDALVETTYGWSLLAKVGLLALVLPLAAYNLLRVRPQLSALARTAAGPSIGLVHNFRQAVRGELGLLALVLAAAAVLTGLATGREELARKQQAEFQTGPVDRQVVAQAVPLRLRVTPAMLGPNRFSVELPAETAAAAERVQYTLTYLDQDLGSQPLVLQRTDDTSPVWSATSPVMSQAGRWQADVLVRRQGQDDLVSSIRYSVLGPGAAAPATSGVAYPLLPTVAASLAIVVAAVGAAGVLAGLLGKAGRRTAIRFGVVAMSGLVVLAGGAAYARESSEGLSVDVLNVRNPVPPDERSLAAGRDIYQRCAVCHGAEGRGDGPAAASLNPKPANLRVHMAVGHSDGEILYRISVGVPGTAMPAWKSQLTEEERWDLLNYLKTLADPSEAAEYPEDD